MNKEQILFELGKLKGMESRGVKYIRIENMINLLNKLIKEKEN